ncbi:MAG: hypothetical protein OEY59_09860, partial [Deltaproteobacteria bacterium]|nr:hypothetical protein [Deltaproteobacteria bacterium]
IIEAWTSKPLSLSSALALAFAFAFALAFAFAFALAFVFALGLVLVSNLVLNQINLRHINPQQRESLFEQKDSSLQKEKISA